METIIQYQHLAHCHTLGSHEKVFLQIITKQISYRNFSNICPLCFDFIARSYFVITTPTLLMLFLIASSFASSYAFIIYIICCKLPFYFLSSQPKCYSVQVSLRSELCFVKAALFSEAVSIEITIPL